VKQRNLHIEIHKKVLSAPSVLFFAAALSILTLFAVYTWGRDAYEIVSANLSTDGGRAFEYGERHFSASDADAYNVTLAEYFFRRAAALDPTIPYLYHELARIDFLKGHFSLALSEINVQIFNQGHKTENSYYVRGLIEGYMGDYDAAARDYAYFLSVDPNDWATANDYAWILLKANRNKDAEQVTADALKIHPSNTWLLATRAIALYELGDYAAALASAKKAQILASQLTERDWLVSYPGNDPAIAAEGIQTLRNSIAENIHKIEEALGNSEVKS
jgi:tetratricopeptide (TPR) repeat protein